MKQQPRTMTSLALDEDSVGPLALGNGNGNGNGTAVALARARPVRAQRRQRATPALTLSPEEMRRLGHQAVDAIVDQLAGLRQSPVAAPAAPADVANLLGEPLPVSGSAPEEVLQQAFDEVLSAATRLDHPRFFAYVPAPSNFMGVLADALASGFGTFAGLWQLGAGPAAVELTTLRWLRELFGLPSSAGGIFTDGGSSANLVGLTVARRAVLGDDLERAVVYASDQTHTAVERGLRVLGLQPDQLRLLPADEGLRLPLERLRQQLAADREAGRRPFCVIANAGTTNTGAVDPLPELAALCHEQGLWFHVDACLGAAAITTEEGRKLLRGIQHADSLAFDAHKWLFQPIEAGCVLVRDEQLLESTFTVHPACLADAAACGVEVNFCDRGLQLTRSFRAFKLWMALKTFGLDGFGAAVRHGFELARYAEMLVGSYPVWELAAPTTLALVTFRYDDPERPAEEVEAINRSIAAVMLRDPYAMLSSTTVRGQTILRMCTVNPRTTKADVMATLGRVAEVTELASARC